MKNRYLGTKKYVLCQTPSERHLCEFFLEILPSTSSARIHITVAVASSNEILPSLLTILVG